MSNIITISREFGSGGRELGKRLADALGYAYYDREILSELAKNTQKDQQYIEKIMENQFNVPLHFERSFSSYAIGGGQAVSLLVEQQKIIKELAKKDKCIIVGRGANAILREYQPFSIFVYADWPSKIARCRQKDDTPEKVSYKNWQKKIRQVDAARAKQMELFSDLKWGDKQGYSLCVNTSNVSIKAIIPALADYARIWLGGDN